MNDVIASAEACMSPLRCVIKRHHEWQSWGYKMWLGFPPDPWMPNKHEMQVSQRLIWC
jgi:hypothetical protein